MDKLDNLLKAHFTEEEYTCTDSFLAEVCRHTTPAKPRIRIRGLAIAAALCLLLALGAAAGGLRVFLPGRGFAADDGLAYYTAEQTRLGKCLIDSAIASDGRLTVWLYNDYKETAAPDTLTLISGDTRLVADAEGINANISPGNGYSVFTFEFPDGIPDELTLSDGINSTALRLCKNSPESSFTMTSGGYTITLSQLTEGSRLLATEVDFDKLDPIAAEAAALRFKLAEHGIFPGEATSLAYTEDSVYAISSHSYGIKYWSPEGLEAIEYANREYGTNFPSERISYMISELEQLDKRGHSDELTLDSKITRVELDRLSLLAKSSSIGYPLESSRWESDAFDTARLTVPAVGSDKLTFDEPVRLKIGDEFALLLTAIERGESRWGERLLIDFELETDSPVLDGIVIDSVYLMLPGWSVSFSLEAGRICLHAGDKLATVETATAEAELPVALFELAYSLPINN